MRTPESMPQPYHSRLADRRATPDQEGITFRMGCAVDIVRYSERSATLRHDARGRLHSMLAATLSDVGVDAGAVDAESTGDGVIAFLPSGAPLQLALPLLLHGMAERLHLDNARFRDRIRVRMATSIGPVRVDQTGFSENTVIELCRLLDSQTLRRAVDARHSADLSVLVSRQLYACTVGAGHTGFHADEFRAVRIRAKGFQAAAWLWTPPDAGDSSMPCDVGAELGDCPHRLSQRLWARRAPLAWGRRTTAQATRSL